MVGPIFYPVFFPKPAFQFLEVSRADPADDIPSKVFTARQVRGADLTGIPLFVRGFRAICCPMSLSGIIITMNSRRPLVILVKVATGDVSIRDVDVVDIVYQTAWSIGEVIEGIYDGQPDWSAYLREQLQKYFRIIQQISAATVKFPQVPVPDVG